MHWDVISVEPVAPLALQVHFADGTAGRVQFEPCHLTGVFAVLADPAFFIQVSAHDGFVTWPGELDLAPDTMYQEIKAHGQWVLR